MWDTFGDLPLHPLAVHAPIVLLPLLAVIASAYAVIWPWRRYLAWALIGLAVVAPASATVTVLSGRELEKGLGGGTDATNRHQDFGENAWYLAIALGATALALWLVARAIPKDATAQDNRARILRISSVVLSVVVVVISVFAVYYLVRAGHSGAEMRWKGVLG